MAERKIRVHAVRLDKVDIDKFVAGLMQLLRDRATAESSQDEEEPAA